MSVPSAAHCELLWRGHWSFLSLVCFPEKPHQVHRGQVWQCAPWRPVCRSHWFFFLEALWWVETKTHSTYGQMHPDCCLLPWVLLTPCSVGHGFFGMSPALLLIQQICGVILPNLHHWISHFPSLYNHFASSDPFLVLPEAELPTVCPHFSETW